MSERENCTAPAAARFDAFVHDRSAGLLRTAWLLTGNEASAQDLVQTALVRTWVNWDRVDRQDAPEAYVRRVMLSTYLTWRRRFWTREEPTDFAPDDGTDAASGTSDVDRWELRAVLTQALDGLSRGQRAVLVLRYFDDLSEAQTAAALGCSVGTVKSQSARALTRLRQQGQLGDLWNGG